VTVGSRVAEPTKSRRSPAAGELLPAQVSPTGNVLRAALLEPACYPHAVARVELIETHISWVFLAGDYAYKVKKPVRLGFLDFSTLEARRFYCGEELRLNRRTAPELYLEVVPVAGTFDAPRVEGEGAVIDYALKMRRFPQEALADRIAKQGGLNPDRIDAIAAVLSAFHAAIPAARQDEGFGAFEHVAAPALANFDEIAELASDSPDSSRFERLRAWTSGEAGRLRRTFAARKRDGFVRECHGDLHLGNIVFLEDRPVPFDCIEFNPELRWIDVINEAAFLVMDLLDHRLEAAAFRFLNAYLEANGDYAGLSVLKFYCVYRAIVRAKVACIRGRQACNDSSARLALREEYRGYLALAESLAKEGRGGVVLMHGLAGSGKTTVSQILLERIGAVRVRSDVERKRLHGLASRARTRAAPYAGIYAPETTRVTYDRLERVVRDIVASGRVAIVDAAFLARAERGRFRSLAGVLGVPCVIASCFAAESTLRARVARREAAKNDASEAGIAVLENQLATQESLGPEELALTIGVPSEAGVEELRRTLDAIAIRLSLKDVAHAPR
jgi:aminoglycoside phosphotransferase family enzyme/predicted kinase